MVNTVNWVAQYYQKMGFILEKNNTNKDEKIAELEIGKRRGFPIYRSNPSLINLDQGQIKQNATKVIHGNKAMLMDTATGEITGEGAVAFLEREEVDPERFVKLYLAGLDGMFKLAKSGQAVFKLLWLQVQAKPNSDRVELNHFIAEEYGLGITYRMVNRGIKELLEKEFIYHSPTAGMFYYNARFLFNGNRILTAKEYVLQGTEQQQELPLGEVDD